MAAKKINGPLRRWAVEQAMKWPQVSSGSGGGGGYLGGGGGPIYSDADVIGRAKRLEDYVSGKSK